MSSVANVDRVVKKVPQTIVLRVNLSSLCIFLSALLLHLRGMPRAPKVIPVSKTAPPYRVMIRLSDEEAKMLQVFSEKFGETRSQLIRLLIHSLNAEGLRPGAEAIVFDFATEHTISRNLRVIGALYTTNRSPR